MRTHVCFGGRGRVPSCPRPAQPSACLTLAESAALVYVGRPRAGGFVARWSSSDLATGRQHASVCERTSGSGLGLAGKGRGAVGGRQAKGRCGVLTAPRTEYSMESTHGEMSSIVVRPPRAPAASSTAPAPATTAARQDLHIAATHSAPPRVACSNKGRVAWFSSPSFVGLRRQEHVLAISHLARCRDLEIWSHVRRARCMFPRS